MKPNWIILIQNLKYIFSAVVLVAALSSCTVTVPYAVTDNPIGAKKGVSKTAVILGTIQLNGNYGVAEAAKKGRIKGGISTIDIRTTSYFGPIFYTKELIVTGAEE